MTYERFALLLLGCLNVGAGAMLAYPGLELPVPVRAGVVIAQAMTVFALASIKSWGDAAP